ncbi:hypothetical protein J6590_042045 [Homalodisca vitripennis]|nr:hypothetical protein J6590_042045 [Homalodisca vitripennis]
MVPSLCLGPDTSICLSLGHGHTYLASCQTHTKAYLSQIYCPFLSEGNSYPAAAKKATKAIYGKPLLSYHLKNRHLFRVYDGERKEERLPLQALPGRKYFHVPTIKRKVLKGVVGGGFTRVFHGLQADELTGPDSDLHSRAWLRVIRNDRSYVTPHAESSFILQDLNGFGQIMFGHFEVVVLAYALMNSRRHTRQKYVSHYTRQDRVVVIYSRPYIPPVTPRHIPAGGCDRSPSHRVHRDRGIRVTGSGRNHDLVITEDNSDELYEKELPMRPWKRLELSECRTGIFERTRHKGIKCHV